MWPNLFVIGAAKSATSSLHYYLSCHPEIHMSREKEPNFFSVSSDSWGPTHAISSRTEYERLFDSPKPIRGESSVTYSFWPYPSGVPERIHAVAPEAKLIYLVRDPVDRAISHYHDRVSRGAEKRSLAEVVAEPHDHEERYLAASRYATQAERYLERFPHEQLLVIEHAELASDRDAVMSECFAFLGVDPSFTSPRWSLELNTRDDQRVFSPLAEWIRYRPAYRRLAASIRPDVRRRLIAPARGMLTHRVEREPQDEAGARAIFAERLTGEADRLRRLTGKPFRSWSV